MVDIADINDGKSLQAWLGALPFDADENRRIAVTIAHRAAMRVLPMYWQWVLVSQQARTIDLTPLPVLRSSLISGVASIIPTPKIRSAARAAATGAIADATRAGNAVTADGTYAAPIARAANAATATADGTYADTIARAANAPTYAENSAYGAPIWKETRSDCRLLEPGNVLLDETPLWSGKNPLSDKWQDTRLNLPEGWEFWRDWYQGALDGVKPNWDMLTRIALIEPEDWDKGPDHVNRLIAEIVDKHSSPDKFQNETATPKASELARQAKHVIAQRVQFNRDGLALSLAGVLEQIAAFREKIRGLNGLDPEYRDDLLNFLDELSGNLDELLHAIPDENEEISDEKATRLGEWWQRFQPLAVNKSRAYVSPENVADAVIPSGIILGCAGIGGIVGGPVGAGAGAYVGGLITGYVKPNKAVDELLKQSSDTSAEG